MLFIGEALLPLTTAGSQALSQVTEKSINHYNQPMIQTGDFNINFALPLLEFFDKNFSLKMINAIDDPTTKGGTSINAIFATSIDKITCKNFISYFSYHNPIIAYTFHFTLFFSPFTLHTYHTFFNPFEIQNDPKKFFWLLSYKKFHF